ncbi:23 kDa integral membrane protein-like [Drosophila subpulchrella]|uniref:23 kDa integral membrane protein-like n=1 Tax=Drosophila subpulchrella TaxID=1486046 RepID=UPI0018A12E47|nr:23 kDa integral membrane protein-like [Drosophila subpulchrella]
MGCTGCVKCFLITLNTLNALSGLLLIAIATFALSKAPLAYIEFLYGLGGVIFVSAILGCCGICRENVCMTATYGFLLLGQLIISLLSIFYIESLWEYIEELTKKDVPNKWNEEMVEPGAMDTYQTLYECCGRDSPDDYVIGRKTLPSSCYPQGDTQGIPYQDGCALTTSKIFLNHLSTATGIYLYELAIIVPMVLGAIYLVIRFRKQRTRYSY